MRIIMPVAILIAVISSFAYGADRLDLKDNWSLQSSAKIKPDAKDISSVGYKADQWYPISVPSTLLAAMVADKVYPDPFFGDNITKIPGYKNSMPPWLVMDKESPFYPTWWYRTEFDAPADFADKQLVLHLDGINFRANVWLNGKQIAADDKIRGMFRRFELPVTGMIKTGAKNCLAVEITAPGHIEQPDKRTKQIEATTGWDDHNPQPPDLNAGIWQPVYITASGPAVLRYPYVNAKLDPALKPAQLTVSARVINKTDKKVSGKVIGAIEQVKFEKGVELAPNETKEVVFTPAEFPQLIFANPRLWWPVNLGSQELYELALELQIDGKTSDAAKTTFGIRDATTYINDEGWRAYKVNGRNVLIRGGACMTSDMLLRLSPKRYDALVRYAREGNLNMLRSEGFSIRETEDFYNSCDKYGVMVTQQIFGRSIPDEQLAIDCIEDMMLRIRNHPSLVHFLGHDETFPTETLDAAYKDLIAKLNVNRTYQPHSGAFNQDDRFKTGGTRTGSLQVWTYAPPNHYYIAKDTGAWGFAQSGGIGGIFASYDSMRRMMPEEALWPPFTPTWSLHTVTQGGKYFDAVLDAINKRYGESQNLRDFLTKAWMLNYESARGMFEAYGRNKYSATGITTWKYDAAWPASPTWQYIDWYLSPTGGYYGAKKACEPLHVQYSYDDGSIWVVNTFGQEFKGLKVAARLLNQDMSEKWTKTGEIGVAADGKTKVFAVERPQDMSKAHFLWLQLTDKDGKVRSENFYWLSTVPDTPNEKSRLFAKPVSMADYTDLKALPPVELKKSIEFAKQGSDQVAKVILENTSPNLALFVRLALKPAKGENEISPIYWSDNCFSVLPNTKKEITANFAAEDTGEGTPTLVVEGWNVK